MPLVEVSPAQRLQDPFAKCGVVFVTWPDGTSTQGSCAVVGRNDILTAAHLVYNPDRGGWATDLAFYFGADYNPSSNRFDSFQFSYSLPSGTFAWTARAWADQVYTDGDNATFTWAESQFDVAVIGVSKAIGDVTGWFGLDWGRDYTQWVTQVGYPRIGTGMMTSAVNATRDPLWNVYRTSTDNMGPGSSGGPIFTSDGYVIGVASSGSGTETTWADFGFLATHLIELLSSNDELLIRLPTYQVQASTASVSEGSSAVFTLSTTHVAAGTTVGYTITGVSSSDIVGGALFGSAIVGANGQATITVPIAADRTTEGPETLTVTAAGSSASMQVLDTSLTPASYAVQAAATSVNEGSTATFTLSTTNVAAGTSVAYVVSGVSAADLVGGTLSGVATIGANGRATIALPIAADRLTEGTETLTVTVQGASASMQIIDTSIATPTYAIQAAAASVNEGSTATFTVLTTNVAAGTSVAYLVSGVSAADLVGGAFAGVTTIGSNGRATISLPIAADSLTEGPETLTVTAQGVSASMQVIDTSITPVTVPAPIWTRTLGTSSFERASAVSAGPDGAVYVMGYSSGPLDGQTNAGNSDAFITRYEANGTKAWTRLLGSTGYDWFLGSAIGADGAIYAAGYANGSIAGQTASGGNDILLARYEQDGTRAWVRSYGSAGNDVALAVATSPDGAIFTVGYTGSQLDGQAYAGGGADGFISRYSADGARLWSRLIGTSATDSAGAIAVANDGNIFVAGQTYGSLDGQSNRGLDDAFLTRLSADGTRLWTRLLGSTESEWASDIAVAPDGSIYLVGSTSGSLEGQTNAGLRDAFVARFDPSGNHLWTRTLGSTAFDSANSVTIGLDGSVYVGGVLGAPIDGQPGASGWDAFLARYGADGTRIWLRTLGSTNSDEATALATGADGAVIMAGATSGNLDGQSQSGNGDAFVGRWRVSDPAPSFSLVAHASVVSEKTSAGFTLTTTGLPSGSVVPYRIAGLSSSDLLGGHLAGSAVIGSNGRATILVPLADDQVFEGLETMTVWAGGVSASTIVADASNTNAIPASFALVSRPFGPYGVSAVTTSTLPQNTPDLLVARVDHAWTAAFRSSTEQLLGWYQANGMLREFTTTTLLEVADAGLRSTEPDGMVQVLGIIADADLSTGTPVFDGLFAAPAARIGSALGADTWTL